MNNIHGTPTSGGGGSDWREILDTEWLLPILGAIWFAAVIVGVTLWLITR